MLSVRVPTSSSSLFRSTSTWRIFCLSSSTPAALAANCDSRWLRSNGTVLISAWIRRIFCCRSWRMSSCSNSECTCAEVIDSAERRQSPPGGPNLIEGIEDLLRPRAHRDVLRKIDPTNHSVRINKKFGRPRNVSAFRPRAGMQYIVTANDFGVGIGKQRKTVAEPLRLPSVDLRRINADADYAY